MLSTSKIFVIPLDQKYEMIDTFITDQEICRSKLFTTIRLQKEFIITRSLLRFLLSKITGQHPTKIHFRYNQYGKPYIVNSKTYFNISRAQNYLLIAISNTEVGIDLEYIKQNIHIADIEEYVFSFDEKQCYQNLKLEKIEYFFNVWSLKESILKLIGVGLNQPMNRLEIFREGLDLLQTSIIPSKFNNKVLYSQKLQFHTKYICYISSYYNTKFTLYHVNSDGSLNIVT